MKASKLLTRLASLGWNPGLTERSYELICEAGFRGMESHVTAAILCELVIDNQPLTVRSAMYRATSAGLFPSTSDKYYDKTCRILSRMRKVGLISYEYIVDNLRVTQKPSSWSGLEDFADTVRNAYRRDFWSALPHYVHILCEKDAIAGSIAPVTQEYDVALSPIRGYISDSYAHELGSRWREIQKPVFVYYVGDFDPSGMDLERNAQQKIEEFCGGVIWYRLGINDEDFDDFNLLELNVKRKDARSTAFVDEYGERCAEIDALPPPELRRRVKEAIESHIPQNAWKRLQDVEQLEKETFNKMLNGLATPQLHDDFVTKEERDRLDMQAQMEMLRRWAM